MKWYLAARSAEGAIGGYGDGVKVASVASQVLLEGEVRKVPHLDLKTTRCRR